MISGNYSSNLLKVLVSILNTESTFFASLTAGSFHIKHNSHMEVTPMQRAPRVSDNKRKRTLCRHLNLHPYRWLFALCRLTV